MLRKIATQAAAPTDGRWRSRSTEQAQSSRRRIPCPGNAPFSFPGGSITLAVLLDSRGCATLKEKISGPLAKPSVRQTSLLRTLTGPLSGMLEKAWEIVEPGECRPFYRGAVEHPPSP